MTTILMRLALAALAALAVSAGAYAQTGSPVIGPADERPVPPSAAPPAIGPAFEIPMPDPMDRIAPGAMRVPASPVAQYDPAALPEPVARLREWLIETSLAGELEALRPFLEAGADATQLSLTDVDADPIDFLLEVSGDAEGQEILAILYEVLDSGFVHLEPGTPNEIFVWPYFVAAPLLELTPRQRVELFTLVTAGDYEDMKAIGAYNFFRVGITPDGRWSFFLAGE